MPRPQRLSPQDSSSVDTPIRDKGTSSGSRLHLEPRRVSKTRLPSPHCKWATGHNHKHRSTPPFLPNKPMDRFLQPKWPTRLSSTCRASVLLPCASNQGTSKVQRRSQSLSRPFTPPWPGPISWSAECLSSAPMLRP